MRVSRLLRLTAIGIVVRVALGAPANPLGSLYDQPDGSTTPEIFMKGDQRYNWKTDKNGYTVIQDDRGWWVYAKQTDGDLVSSGVRIGRGNPKKLGLATNLKIHPSKRQKHGLHDLDEASKEHRSLINVPARALCNFQGTRNSPCRLKALVVLVMLSNHVNRQLPSPEEYDVLFNNNVSACWSKHVLRSLARLFSHSVLRLHRARPPTTPPRLVQCRLCSWPTRTTPSCSRQPLRRGFPSIARKWTRWMASGV